MQSTQRRFGHLRAVLHDVPQAFLWQQVARAVDGWPEADFARVALPYILGNPRWARLGHRPAPRRWVLEALGGERVPELVLANAMVLQAMEVEEARGWHHAKAWIRQMESVELWGNPEDEMTRFLELCDFSVFDALTALSFSFCHLGPRGADFLATESWGLDDLRALHLDQAQLGAPGLRALCQAPWFAQLQRLDIQWEPAQTDSQFQHALHDILHDRGAKELMHLGLEGNALLGTLPLEGALCTQLRTLILSLNELQSPCQESLERTPFVHTLERLHLDGNRTADADIALLANAPLHSLKSLAVGSHPHSGAALIEAVCQNTHIQGLTALDLSYTDLSCEHLAALIMAQPDATRTRMWGELRRLELDGAQDLSGLITLLEGPFAHLRLKHLTLDDTRWTPQLCARLAGLGALRELEVLHLARCELHDVHIQALFPTGSWQHLQVLRLGPNPITAASFSWLATSQACPGLFELEVGSMNHDLNVAALGSWDAIKGLHKLGLWGVESELSSMSALLDVCAQSLEALSIHHSVLRAQVLSLILEEELPFLHTLSLPFDLEEEEVVDDLIHAEFVPQLHTLTLEHPYEKSWLIDRFSMFDVSTLPVVIRRELETTRCDRM